jgi:DNA-binding LacI/PurR family transcriptional regulator
MSIVKIARRAGVSTATVSRVLNGLPGVRDATRSQVQAAVAKLKYVVPQVKRGPKPGSKRRAREIPRDNNTSSTSSGLAISGRRGTGTIAVIAVGAVGKGADWLQMPVMAACVGGISRAASDAGLKVLLTEILDLRNPNPLLSNKEIDGALVFLNSDMKPKDFSDALTALQRYVPVVWAMGGDAGAYAVDHVIPDDRAIARLAFNHLTTRGCRELAFMTQNPRWAMMRNRGQAFASFSHDAGTNWSSYLVSPDLREGELFGARAVVEPDLNLLVDRLARKSPRPDGLFIGNDATTALVHPMLLKRGIVPGKDIELVSCDNEQVRLAGLMPRPLSIDIGSAEVGAAAVRRLRFRLEHPTEPPVLMKVLPSIPDYTSEITSG